ncbi:FAD-binding oxidoreductase [Alginatibacterium sediminis]|uniref:D-2-hydroxyglutarate dehydrogenase n=1 Tax=Alginatibacterium sediminis TaxID=2164068 RepID=A0A420EG84_9ALTE|nr:FAD-binding and (Fe-S)-binding domain-containing protein [Alginatibacterium sediminis]RKF19721.1 FAD-binding oxidoreductase [Alginatibacterium sediminis]
MIPKLSSAQLLSQIYIDFLDDLSKTQFSGEIENSYASRLAVSTDNSVYQQLPQAVVLPRSHSDVITVMTLAGKERYQQVAFSPRGGGTGTNGQSLTTGIVLDLSRHMKGVLELNVEERWVRVETGIVKDALNAELKQHGLFFSPDLSTSNRATLGGMINTDASGQGSLVYGKTSDHVLALKAVLANGTSIDTAAVDLNDLPSDPNQSEIYQTARAICVDKRQQIEAKFPKLNRFLTGYDLKNCFNPQQQSLDLSRLLCGSEGSLAVITEAKLDLTPIPKFRTLVTVKYDSFNAALRHAPTLVKAKALSVETIDSKVLNLAREDVVWKSVDHLISDVPNIDMSGINIVEFAEDDQQTQLDKVNALIESLSDSSALGVIGTQVCDDLTGVMAIYNMRKKAVGLLGNAKGSAKPIAFVEDTCVPPENLADYIVEFRALLDQHGLSYGMFGHVDSGVLHVRPALDLIDPEQELLLREISDQVVALTAKYGGLMWGEHGKGYRSEYSPAFFGDELFACLREIKSSFDPYNQLNPGKICTPLESDAQLVSVDSVKRASFDRQIPVQIRESYSEAMLCNGNGLCFNYDVHSPMCPSSKVSGDRRYSPKGRAGLIREWLRLLSDDQKDVLEIEQAQMNAPMWHNLWQKTQNTWRKKQEQDFNHEVMDAMQTCLACKACSTACPIKVDVPNFRARFMYLYYGRYLRPAKDYFVAEVENYAPLMAKAPGFFNWFTDQSWMQSAIKHSIGMVDIPRLSQPNLKQRLSTHLNSDYDYLALNAMSAEQKAKTVLIVQDPFTSNYEADLVEDFIKLCQKLDVNPIVLPFSPNGKAQHIKGFLKDFQKTATTTATFLNQVAQLNIAMVGVEPALVLCYRDEYKQVLADKRGDFQVHMVQEWLSEQIKDNSQLPQLRDQEPWQLFGHCTEKSLAASAEGQWQQVFAAFGGKLSPVAVGCCGMAGTYGHDAKQVETSQTIYRQSWQVRLAEYDRERCLATGYSCRSQVKRFEGQKLKHPLQALLENL